MDSEPHVQTQQYILIRIEPRVLSSCYVHQLYESTRTVSLSKAIPIHKDSEPHAHKPYAFVRIISFMFKHNVNS